MGGIEASRLWYILVALTAQQSEHEIVDDRHGLLAIPNPQMTPVLAQSLIPPIMQAVLNLPVFAHQR